jgi:hypothetical protein
VDGADVQGNGILLRESASHAVPVEHKRVTVVEQINPELLELLPGRLVPEHVRHLVPLVRHHNFGLIDAVQQKQLVRAARLPRRDLAAAAADASIRRFLCGRFLVGRHGGLLLAFSPLLREGAQHLLAVRNKSGSNGIVLDVRETPKFRVQNRRAAVKWMNLEASGYADPGGHDGVR